MMDDRFLKLQNFCAKLQGGPDAALMAEILRDQQLRERVYGQVPVETRELLYRILGVNSQ